MLPVNGSCETGLLRHFSNHFFQSPYFRKYISYDGHLFLTMSKIWCRFEKYTKNLENVFCFWDKCTWIGCIKMSLLRRKYLSWAANVLTNSREVFQRNYVHGDMVKIQSLRLNQWFGPFTISPIEGSSEARLFRHLSNQVFRSLQFRKCISYEDHLFLRMFKISCTFKKCRKKLGKSFFVFEINASELVALNYLY